MIPTKTDAHELRDAMQALVRTFGLLAPRKTPCGQPVSVSEAHALMALLMHPKGAARLTQRELGAHLNLDKSNISRLCARMRRAGTLESQPCPRDRRARRLDLTEAGRARAAQVDAASRSRFDALFAALPPDAPADVIATLRTLSHAIASIADSGPPK